MLGSNMKVIKNYWQNISSKIAVHKLHIDPLVYISDANIVFKHNYESGNIQKVFLNKLFDIVYSYFVKIYCLIDDCS